MEAILNFLNQWRYVAFTGQISKLNIDFIFPVNITVNILTINHRAAECILSPCSQNAASKFNIFLCKNPHFLYQENTGIDMLLYQNPKLYSSIKRLFRQLSTILFKLIN